MANPAFKDGVPLFIDSGGGVMKPAFADDPCTCCGPPIVCGDCDFSLLTPTVTLPDRGIDHPSQTATLTWSPFGDCNGCVGAGCIGGYFGFLDEAATYQACISHDDATGLTTLSVSDGSIGGCCWSETFSGISCSSSVGGGGASVPCIRCGAGPCPYGDVIWH